MFGHKILSIIPDLGVATFLLSRCTCVVTKVSATESGLGNASVYHVM